MKKILLSLIFVVLLVADSYGLPSLRVEAERWTRPSRTSKPATQRQGTYREYFDNGVLKSEKNFKDDQLHGRCRSYYKKGNLRQQVNYQEGIINGKAFEFYENGQYKLESNYNNGKADGVSKLYYNNGNLYSFMVYNNGQLIKETILDTKGRAIRN